jgi:hypothetical protein
MARDEIVGGADGDGDGFAFEIRDRLDLRARYQCMKRSSQRQADQAYRGAGNAAA